MGAKRREFEAHGIHGRAQTGETTDYSDGHGFGLLPTKHTKHAKRESCLHAERHRFFGGHRPPLQARPLAAKRWSLAAQLRAKAELRTKISPNAVRRRAGGAAVGGRA
jgi:hypothetical protein